ncbi:MAG: hypothetical protein HZA79_02575 [Sphingobacteriales bacterium]|nr:hypothetical protein [Sphingobacteriales bacterium]
MERENLTGRVYIKNCHRRLKWLLKETFSYDLTGLPTRELNLVNPTQPKTDSIIP